MDAIFHVGLYFYFRQKLIVNRMYGFRGFGLKNHIQQTCYKIERLRISRRKERFN